MVKSQEYQIATKKHLAIIAPLDWGLGHTTRCIPIIRELQENNFDIVIACNSEQKVIFEAEFSNLRFAYLEGYGLKYGASRISTILNLILQVPKILISVKREKIQFTRILSQFTPNIIISDNRYGLFSSPIRSIFITHQLEIITGAGKLADRLANFVSHRLIKRFDECWVPDFEGSANLAGALSHPSSRPAFPVRYIGALSRFHNCEDPGSNVISNVERREPAFSESAVSNIERSQRATTESAVASVENSDRTIIDSAVTSVEVSENAIIGSAVNQESADIAVNELLVILSGPEPQRTRLESLLLKQLAAYNGDVTMVRGLPLETKLHSTSPNIKLINFAGSKRLNELICKARIIICRSGYTSVMDLVKLGKQAVLIPTPGQGEQEYLADYLGAKKIAIIAQQEKLDILQSISLAESLLPPVFEGMDEYKKVISRLASDYPVNSQIVVGEHPADRTTAD